MRTQIQNNAQLKSLVERQIGLAVYFSSPECGVCHALKSKLENMFKADFPLVSFAEIQISSQPEIAGQNQVFKVPVLLFFYEGKEVFRWVGNMGLAQVERQVRKVYWSFSPENESQTSEKTTKN